MLFKRTQVFSDRLRGPVAGRLKLHYPVHAIADCSLGHASITSPGFLKIKNNKAKSYLFTMPKTIKHTRLSVALRKALEDVSEPHLEHRFTIPAASDHFLGKFNLAPEKLERVRMLEAHSLRLQESIARVNERAPLTIRTARKIIDKVISQIPGYIERNRQNLKLTQAQNLRELEANLRRDLQKIKEAPGEVPTTLSRNFLQTATALYGEELRNELGAELAEKYFKAMRRTQKALAVRKR